MIVYRNKKSKVADEKIPHPVGTNLPVTMNISPIGLSEVTELGNLEEHFRKEKEEKLKKKFLKTNSNLSKVNIKIQNHFLPTTDNPTGNKEINPDKLQQIANDLGLKMGAVMQMIQELNYLPSNICDTFLIPVPKKKGNYQKVERDENTFEKWRETKVKTIATMEQVRSNADQKAEIHFPKKDRMKKIEIEKQAKIKKKLEAKMKKKSNFDESDLGEDE